MDQKQFDAMNKRIEGLEGQLGEIKSLVEGKFAAAPAATTAPAAAGDPKPDQGKPDGNQPQGETGQDFAAFAASIIETAVAPLRQKLDDMDRRFAAARPGAAVADTTGPASDLTPLI